MENNNQENMSVEEIVSTNFTSQLNTFSVVIEKASECIMLCYFNNSPIFTDQLKDVKSFRPGKFENLNINYHTLLSLKKMLDEFRVKASNYSQIDPNNLYMSNKQEELDMYISLIGYLISMHAVMVEINRKSESASGTVNIRLLNSINTKIQQLLSVIEQMKRYEFKDTMFLYNVSKITDTVELVEKVCLTTREVINFSVNVLKASSIIDNFENSNTENQNKTIPIISEKEQEKINKIRIVNEAFEDIKDILRDLPTNLSTKSEVAELKREFDKLTKSFSFPLGMDSRFNKITKAEIGLNYIYCLIESIKAKSNFVDNFPKYLEAEITLD